ncbi:hypothetical protein [Lacipirellula parvula]|uniref:VOC domain-containing protein n=1 Tax=Lacipirellula parvula TaxID=2650471 RepID=A0A5K7XI09_9BACT|nr:hypothetical protein [Lacipirellula parvula]BBO35682.1 hypothetical protein PLANPX_5294 [Lacipirellula parvula]
MSLSIRDFKVYMPAKDFSLSKKFYSALGFTQSEGWGGTADFALNGFRFRLQDFYVKDWAENFMVVINVDDAEEWRARALELEATGEFSGMSVRPLEKTGDTVLFHVLDPTGVLLIFVQ